MSQPAATPDVRVREVADAAKRAFGRIGVAAVTPFTAAGDLDEPAFSALVDHLIGLGHDLIVVSGTTGEAPTTTDAEKRRLIELAVAASAGRAKIVAGVGTNDTRHSVELATQAHAAGAEGLLVVTPYYSRPTQAGVVAHVLAVADATPLPVMLYDIPARAGIALTEATIAELAEHPRVLAVKDATGELPKASRVIAAGRIAVYSGEDAVTHALLAAGAVGTVSVVSHVVGEHVADLVRAHERGDLAAARAAHDAQQGAFRAIMQLLPGVAAVKAVLADRGLLPTKTTRLPLLPASPSELDQITDILTTP